MEMLLILGLLGAVVVALVLGGFFALIALTCLIYIISHLYPWLRKIMAWCARPENFFSLLFLAILLIVLIVMAAILLRFTLMLFLIVFPILLFIPLDLAIIVYLIKIIQWLYRRWRDLIVNFYVALRLTILRSKLKHEKDKSTDWKISWSEMKNKLLSEADQASSKISRRKS